MATSVYYGHSYSRLDPVVKKIEKVIEKIPGLGAWIEELMNSIAVLVFTTLEVSHAIAFSIWFQTHLV
jgi:hypothetical protein